MNTNQLNFKKVISIILFVIILLTAFYIYNSKTNTAKVAPSSSSLSKKTDLDSKIEAVTPETLYKVGNDKPFYDPLFSSEYKIAYADYIKGVYTYNAGMGKKYDNQFFKKSLTEYSLIYSSSSLSNKERAYSLNMINLIYIASNWDDTLMKDSVFSVGKPKKLFDSLQTRMSEDYPDLTTMKDPFSTYEQTAFLGFISQITMSKLNTISYDLYPTAYSLMRSRMNRVMASKRTWLVRTTYKNLSDIKKINRYYETGEGKDGILAYKIDLERLEKSGMMFTDLGQLSPEIYIMRAVTLWDPLSIFATTKDERVTYFKNYKNDYKKAVDMVNADVQKGKLDKPMIKLYYVAALVDYSITKKKDSVLSDSEKEAYLAEAKDIIHGLIRLNVPAFEEKIRLGNSLSQPPAFLKAGDEYYGGSPFYQLRLLAENDQILKEYLVKEGWKF